MIDFEKADGVIVQFGGQTAISLVEGLERAGIKLLGSSLNVIDELEDRDRFYQLMQRLNLPHIPGLTAKNKEDLIKKAKEIGFPILLRPSYVIGGKGMLVLESEQAIHSHFDTMNTSLHFPILIDAYYPGKEVEVDVVTDGTNIIIPGIFEHVEKAGVHSGDSIAVMPPFSIENNVKKKIVDYAQTIATGIDFKGVFNIQFVFYHKELYVLEVNPRASRTVPVFSKASGINLIELATAALIGKPLPTITSKLGLLRENDYYTIKAPVFSTMKLPGVDPKLVPEMKSTGELIVFSQTLHEGFAKAFLWNEQLATSFVKGKSEVYIDGTLSQQEQLCVKLASSGFTCVSEQHFDKLEKDIVKIDSFHSWIKSDNAFAVVSTSSDSQKREQALQYGLLVFSVEETAEAFANATIDKIQVSSIQQWKNSVKKEVMVQ